MKLRRKLNVYGTVLSLIGLISIVPYLYFYFFNQLTVDSNYIAKANSAPYNQSADLISSTPLVLTLNSVGIKAPIAEGYYDPKTQKWTISDTSAYYANLSTPINNKQGGTLIYGHYKSHMFKPLNDIKTGDIAIVTTKNNYRFIYRYKSAETFQPTDASILNYKGSPRLYLQTCTGIWMQNRKIFTFEFVKYEKIQQKTSVSDVFQDLITQSIAPTGSAPSLNIFVQPS